MAMLVEVRTDTEQCLTYDEIDLWVPVAHLRNDDNQKVYAFAIH